MTLLIFLIWIILNGRITAEILIFGGVLSVAIFFFLNRFLGLTLKRELWIYKNYFLFAAYAVVLVRDIFVANFAVIRLVLSPKREAVQKVVTFKTDLKMTVTRAMLANAITLTPGTITLTLEDGVYTIHCLDEDFVEGLGEGTITKLLRKIEAGAPEERKNG